MRKVIILLLTAMLSCSMAASVFAVDKELMGSSQIYASIDNAFTVKIPAQIDLRDGTNKSEVTINYARIADDKIINVYCMNLAGKGIELTHTEKSDKKIICTLTNLESNAIVTEDVPICSFRSSDIENLTASKEFGLETETIGAVGSYWGLLQYGFAIESE